MACRAPIFSAHCFGECKQHKDIDNVSPNSICEKCGQCSDAASREQQRAAMTAVHPSPSQVLQRYVSSKDHANDDAQAV
ncbi:unnamed protein product [Arctogadus glacialis]